MAPPTKGPATLLEAKTTPMIGVYFDISACEAQSINTRAQEFQSEETNVPVGPW